MRARRDRVRTKAIGDDRTARPMCAERQERVAGARHAKSAALAALSPPPAATGTTGRP